MITFFVYSVVGGIIGALSASLFMMIVKKLITKSPESPGFDYNEGIQ